MAAKDVLNTELKYCSELLQMKEIAVDGSLDKRIEQSKTFIKILQERLEKEECKCK